MRVLLSTIGSRGDVQPLVALAVQLRALGQDVHLCVPPDFREWIEGLGFTVTPIGPELRALTASPAAAAKPLTPDQLRQLGEQSVVTQFATIGEAARGCDVVVGATALQIAAPSIAEHLGVPYVFAAFCPAVLPSAHHPPIVMHIRGDVDPPPDADNRALWAKDAQRWNATWAAILNSCRGRLGLAPVENVLGYVLTAHPWLAADPTLGPRSDDDVFQTGAWLVDDDRPLGDEIVRFLDAGDPPLYFGFGSIRGTPDLSRAMIDSARELGRRAILSRGWAELALPDDATDCLAIGEVNQRALFPRVAAVVHHGGAGTTTVAARAGAPQVVVPQMYDQFYWARRVGELGIGATHAGSVATAESLANAIERTLAPDVVACARSAASWIRTDGARVAAERIAGMR
jgi:vancomycin aglycone glucosyltransferase